ncbi:MAG: hypothetical protein RLZZ234_625 [Candidatus Parcubacteria bacterium]
MAAVALVVGTVSAFWYVGFLPNFDDIRASKDMLHALAERNQILAPFVFSLVYVAVVALSLPLATPLSLLAGFLFGAVLGTFLVVQGATIGAVLIFLLARFFFRDFFEAKVQKFQVKVPSFGTFSDVLVARLIPAVPFSLINIVAGLTRVSLRSYTMATFFGIMPFSFVYVYAGQRIGEIHSLHDITSSESAMFLSRICLVLVALYIIKRVHSARTTKVA